MLAYVCTVIDSKNDMACPNTASYDTTAEHGRIRVNEVFPTWSGSQIREKIQAVWDTWGSEISRATRGTGLRTEWVLGVIMQESGGNTRACSPCGTSCCSMHLGKRCCAFGIMQFTEATALGYGTTPERMMWDPAHAISVGVRLLRDLYEKNGRDFIKALAIYNSGGLYCGSPTTFGYRTNGDYILDVIKWTNAAIDMQLAQTSKPALPLLVFAGVTITGLVMTGILKAEGPVTKWRWNF